MGFRDRLLNRLKRTLGADAEPIVPRPPAPPPRATAPAPEPLRAAPEPEPEPEPEPAPEPPAPEPVPEPAPEPAPAPPPPEPEPEPATEIRTDGLVPGAIPVAVRNLEEGDGEGWASDYATDDAPVRNAHYQKVFEATAAARKVRVLVEEEDLDIVFSCEPGEFILDAADRAGFELPFSCRSGGCLSCSALLLSGQVEMGEQYVLEEEHTEAGYFLLCCSTASSDLVLRSHQEDNIPG